MLLDEGLVGDLLPMAFSTSPRGCGISLDERKPGTRSDRGAGLLEKE